MMKFSNFCESFVGSHQAGGLVNKIKKVIGEDIMYWDVKSVSVPDSNDSMIMIIADNRIQLPYVQKTLSRLKESGFKVVKQDNRTFIITLH